MPNPYSALAPLLEYPWDERVQEYLLTGDTRPVRADLDLTSNCNYRCAHCGDLARNLLNHGGLDRAVLQELVEDLDRLGVAEVSLIGGGEPTLSPHFVDVLDGLAARGIRAGVTTNGSRIDGRVAEAVVRSADWIRFSIDAATQSTYEATHRPQDGTTLDQIHRNLERVARLMPGRVGVGFLIMKRNVSEILTATRQARQLGAGHIRFRFVNHPMTGEIMPAGPPDEVRAALDRASALADEHFSVSIAESLAEGLSEPIRRAQPKDYTRCHVQAFSATITGTGDVYLCSKWRGEPWARLGNVRLTRLSAIWPSLLRQRVIDGVKPCRACSHIYCHAHDQNRWLNRAVAERANPPGPANLGPTEGAVACAVGERGIRDGSSAE